jgi:hypothetical protein
VRGSVQAEPPPCFAKIDEQRVHRWLDAYAGAWESYDLAAIGDLFTAAGVMPLSFDVRCWWLTAFLRRKLLHDYYR